MTAVRLHIKTESYLGSAVLPRIPGLDLSDEDIDYYLHLHRPECRTTYDLLAESKRSEALTHHKLWDLPEHKRIEALYEKAPHLGARHYRERDIKELKIAIHTSLKRKQAEAEARAAESVEDQLLKGAIEAFLPPVEDEEAPF